MGVETRPTERRTPSGAGQPTPAGGIANPLLSLQGVAVGYHRHSVLRDVQFDVPARAVTALVGVNGSGKTTLLRVVLGLLRPLAGRIDTPGGRFPRVGYVPQIDSSEDLFPVTGEQVVSMGHTPHLGVLGRPSAADRELTRQAMERFGVADLGKRRFHALSGGQRQRLLLARALVSRPELLVLDEPVRGLDLPTSARLVRILSELAKQDGLGVLVATHSLDLVANHADVVALVGKGKVTAGPAARIMTDAVLSEFHGEPVHVGTVAGSRVVVPGIAP